MSKLTKRDLGDILQEKFAVKKDDDGDYVAWLDADKDFRYDVIVAFIQYESSDKLQSQAFSPDFKIPADRAADALLFCNKWNKENSYGQAWFNQDNGMFQVNMTIPDSSELPREYIKERAVPLMMAISWQFFKGAGQEF
jgi:hypothetical protein